MADEAILREIPKPDKNFNPSGKSPPGGNKSNKFSPNVYAEKLLLEARQFLGWHQEYYKGGHSSNQSELAQAQSFPDQNNAELLHPVRKTQVGLYAI